MKTKDIIYNKAIEMFSKDSYQNVGMRELAKEVGIKAASIYNHYESKEDILLQIANEFIDQLKKEIYPLYKRFDLTKREYFTNISMTTIKFFETKEINKLCKILIPVQFQSARLSKILHEELIIKPRTALTYYFNDLMQKNQMSASSPQLAAKTYHSFFIYHFYEKYLSNPTISLLEYNELFKNHITFFMNYFNIV